MQEPTISELVKIESGYTSYVDLRLELYDDARNIGRMERYRPISSHRVAFQALSKSLQMKDGRCYLLTGSYGTGKSHLSLMFANYMQTPSSATPMPAFFQNYSEADPNEANSLQTLRSNGRYLVALCQWGGTEDFDEVVLKAVDEALKREQFGEDFDTQYLQAAKKVEEWDKLADSGQSHFYEQFESKLSDANAGITVNAFKKKLLDYDYKALQDFKRIHKKITTVEFTFERTNLIEILTGTLSSEKFKARFQGLFVLWDEFGDNMERGKMHPKAFQQFAQLCAETPTGSARLVFVGTAHKNLTDYAKSYNATEFRTASDRIKQVPLTPDGVEDIISAIVVPQKQNALWKEYIEPRSEVFDGFGTDCTRLKLFEWLKAPQVRSKVIENIYPMHPMATFSLLQLARDVASNNRSVYTFFSENDPGSYTDFICHAPILNGEKLNLYTTDRLCDYFADTLKSDNKELRDTVREKIRDYENSVRALKEVANADTLDSLEFKEDALINRLLRVMLVYEIIGKQNRFDNLSFGLYCTTQAERDILKSRMEALIAKNVLYLVKETGVYEFKRSKAVNLDAMIETWVKHPANLPQNVVAELNELVPLDRDTQYVKANGYNLQYSEDKQLLRRFVRAADLGTVEDTPQGKQDYFQKLEMEIVASIAKKNEYEGVALYVVCENDGEISSAKSFCSNNASERIVVAIPKQPVPLWDAIMEYRALQAIQNGAEYKNFSTQDKSAFNSYLNGDSNRPGAKQALTKLRDKLMNVKEILWNGKYAQTIATDDTKPHDVADYVMGNLYIDRNTFSHDDFNKLHIKVDKTKAVALKEAVEKLLKFTEPISIETDLPQQRGDYRYLQKCLLQHGVLRQVKTEGFTLRCEFEENVSKYQTKLPALAEMICEVRGMNTTGKIRLADWVQKYRRPPYGQGQIALALSLACLRHVFRDSIRFKAQEGELGDIPVRTFDQVLQLIDGTLPNAYLSYRPLSSTEKAAVNAVYSLFGTPDSATAKDYTVVEAHSAMKMWWENLAPIARVAKIYSQEQDIQNFIGVMQKVAGKDAHAFLFEELTTAFGLDGGLMITDDAVDTLNTELPKVKMRLENGLTALEERIINGVRDLFEVEQNTYSDILDGVKQWYNKLDSQQRDPFTKQTNDSKPLVLNLKSVTDIRQTFFVEIPKMPEYGNRAVRDWPSDKVGEYLAQLKSGKEYVEANRIKVEPPTLEPQGEYEWPAGGQLAFKDKIEIRFKTPTNGAKIYITEGSADPTDPAASRHEVKGNEPLLVKENKMIRYAVQDSEGNWSPVQMLNLTNANKEFVPAVGSPNLYGQRPVQFNFPKDGSTLKVTCRELFRKCMELGIVDTSQMECAVLEALQEVKSNP